MQSVNPLEEVINLASLLITLRVLHHLLLGLWWEELTHAGHREHNLLKAPVLTHNLLK